MTDKRPVLKLKQSCVQFRPNITGSRINSLTVECQPWDERKKTRNLYRFYTDTSHSRNDAQTYRDCVMYSLANKQASEKQMITSEVRRSNIVRHSDGTMPSPKFNWQKSELIIPKSWTDQTTSEIRRTQSAPKQLGYLNKTGNIMMKQSAKNRPATVLVNVNRTQQKGIAYRESAHSKVTADESLDRTQKGANTIFQQRNTKCKKYNCGNSHKERLNIREHILRTTPNDLTQSVPELEVSEADNKLFSNNQKSKTTRRFSITLTLDIEMENENCSNGFECGKGENKNENCKNEETSLRDDRVTENDEFTEEDESVDRLVIHHLRQTVHGERKRRRGIVSCKKTECETNSSTVARNKTRKVKGLFTKVVKHARNIVRLLLYMINLSTEMTSRSATEEQWHAVNTITVVRGLAFNKAAFSKKQDIFKVPKWARHILGKAPDERSNDELRRIHALLRGLKSFDKFTEKIQLSMCRAFTYHSVHSGRIILRQGHVGFNFYFLYTGSVFVNIDDTDVHGNQFSKTEVILKRGDSFGELALLQDIRRTATVSCREDCEMLVVDKDTFAKVCPKIFENELEEKINFLSRLPMFSTKVWSRDLIKKMCFETHIQEYKTNKVVVANNATDEWIYVCMQGKCEVIQRLNIDEEIEWGNIQQQEVNRSLLHKQDGDQQDIIDLVGMLGSRTDRSEAGSVDRHSEISSVVEGRQRLLDSMGLEYRHTRRFSIDDMQSLLDMQKRFRNNPRSEPNDSSPGPRRKEDDPTTLTSLLAREMKNNNNILYLNIKMLKPNEIFDIANILTNGDCEAIGSYILVSSGSRLLRIKRTAFFKLVTQDGIQHARNTTETERFPPNHVLLRCYRDYLQWEIFKYSVLDNTLTSKQIAREQLHQYHLPVLRDKNTTKLSSSNDSNKQTLIELQSLFKDVNDDKNNKHRYWKKIEQLSDKTRSKLNTKNKRNTKSSTADVRSKDRRLNKTPKLVIDEEVLPNKVDFYVGKTLSDSSVKVDAKSRRQRRCSVATGLLRRESFYNINPIFRDHRRLSVQYGDKLCETITEDDELFELNSQQKSRMYPRVLN